MKMHASTEGVKEWLHPWQDIEVEGTCIVSCGMDHSLKIWKLTTDLMLSTINQSYTFNPSRSVLPFPTIQQNFPDFSTRDIHRNYVDCVRWLGRFILSKVRDDTCSIGGLLIMLKLYIFFVFK